MVNVQKRKVLKKWVRVTILVLIIIIFLSGISIINRGFELEKKKAKKDPIYNYSISQKLDYQVNLNENSFIKVPYLGENETYITDLVKNIDIKLLYQFSGTKQIPLHYTYEILANIKGEYSLETGEEKTKVWNKENILVEKKEIDTTENQFVVNEEIQLDFNSYNNEVKQFRKELNLPITATLNIIVNINVEGDVGNKLEDEQQLILEIPLNEQAFRITKDYEPTVERAIYEKEILVGKVKNKNLISGIILIIISIFLLVLFFREIFNVQKKTNYTIKLNKILKSYGDIIIELATPLNLEGLNIIDVKNFNEMIDLEEELRIPINFYETIDYYEGEFYIIQGDIAYRYCLTNEE